jgi:hypothetical protein
MNNENLLDYVQSTDIQTTWWSAMWKEESVEGWIRIRNRYQTGDMIHIENLKGYAQRTGAQTSWWSAMWKLETVTAMKSAEEAESISQTITDVNFYPNPVSSGEALTLLLNGVSATEQVTLTFYTLSGTMVSQQVVSPNARVELNIPGGVYIVAIEAANMHVTKRLIVR